MSFDAGALIFKIQTAGYQTFAQQMEAADRAVERVGKTGADAAPKVEKTGTATEQLGKKAKDAKAPLDEQAKSTKKTGDESETASKKQDRQKQSTEQQAEAAKKLGAALTIAGVAVAALVTLSVAKWAEFDKAMSNTSAAVMANAQEQRDLSEAALKAGADTAYSASEAAAAEEELAKAGMSVAEIVGGSLNGALALAAAGQLQVARSAEIMATTLKQFKLPAEEAAHVSDVLAAGAGKAQGSVEDMSLALSYVGPVAAGLGMSLEETGGSIAFLASQGLIGEKAGTALRGVLMSLTSPSALATKTMNEYGIEIFDAQGNMKSLATISEILKQKLGGLTEAERSAALGRIFGNEQITAARVLYQGGADAIEEWTAAVDDSGYAAEQAAMRQDNLAGDIEKLGGAMDTALIRTGSGANDVLREMVQSVTALVDWYGELPAPIQGTVLVLGVATAALALFAGGAIGLRVKFVELKAQLDATNISMGKTALVGGAVGIALTGVVAVVSILAQAQAEARAKAQAYADTLTDGTNRISKATRDLARENLAAKNSFLWMDQGSAYDNAEALGISLDLVTDAAMGSADAIRELQTEIESSKSRHDELGLSAQSAALFADRLSNSVKGEASSLDEAIRIAEQKDKVTEKSVEVTKSAADAYMEQADQVNSVTDALRQLYEEMNAENSAQQKAIKANADFLDGLAGIAKTAEDAGTSLDEATAAGSKNAAMLAGIASDAQAAAEAQYEVDQKTMGAKEAADKYAATLADQKQKFIDSATAAGYNADQVKALADRVFALPNAKAIELLADTQNAMTAVDKLIRDISQKRAVLVVDQAAGQVVRPGQVGINANGSVIVPSLAGVVPFASGGVRRAENHVAQIARAGEWRVWAEPETGGETYVPHALSKRARAEQIMAQTAQIFGGTYIPGGASEYANGSPVTTSPTAISPLPDQLILVVDGHEFTAYVQSRAADVVRTGFSGRSR